VDAGELAISRTPLVLRNGKLVLGEPIPERVTRQVDGRGFTDRASIGDWVSV
jgi:hypothetical protein